MSRAGVWAVSMAVVAGLGGACAPRPQPTADVDVRRSAVLGTCAATPIAISSGFYHTCALMPDHTVDCWGADFYGQTGNSATSAGTTTPTAVSGLTDVIAIAAGGYHSCALRSSGTVACWGYAAEGPALGPGITEQSSTPVAQGITDVTAIAAGYGHSCALRSDGTVWCWGRGAEGELGNGSTADSPTPVQVQGLGPVAAIAARGGTFMCALLAAGGVSCWGWGGRGQLGDGNTNDSSTPVTVVGLDGLTVRELAVGWVHACVVLSDDSARCWGYNGYGQLGDGTTTDSPVPAPVSGLTGVAHISVHGWNTCALSLAGTVSCWGYGADGELGNGGTADSSTPVTVPGLAGVSEISVGGFHTCAVAGGGLTCWGYNGTGQLGNGAMTNSPSPVVVQGVAGVAALAATDSNTCALLSNQTVACWGSNIYGELGAGTVASRVATPTAAAVSQLDDATQISAGGFHVCARRADQTVACWGHNDWGQLGDGTTSDRSSPLAVVGLGNVAEVSAGRNHTCARLMDGTLACWGNNGAGQLGSITAHSPSPLAVPGVSAAVGLFVGPLRTCALFSGGTAMCFGYGLHGELGDGSFSASSSPVPVVGLSGATAIAHGDRHSCAPLVDGTARCWGSNVAGQLGDGTTTDSNVPVTVQGLIGATQIAAGWSHTCALLSDRTVTCWGDNSYGQLGDGSGTRALVPRPVQGLGGVIEIVAGGVHTCARLLDGSARCWGWDQFGQLGNGVAPGSSTPVDVVCELASGSADGQPCAGASECASGFCIDGVCCASACGGGDPGDCQACSTAAGAAAGGICSLVGPTHTCYTAVAFCEASQVCSGTSAACPSPALPPTQCAAATDDPAVCDGEPACAELLGGTSTIGGIEITFFAPFTGEVRAVATGVGCPPPTGFEVLSMGATHGSGTYWDIEADPPAGLPQMKVCIHYAQGTMLEAGVIEQGLRIVHGTSAGCAGTGDWTTLIEAEPPDMGNNVICAYTDSLSPFAIVAPLDLTRPVFPVMPDIVAYATSTSGAVVSYTPPTATDDFDGPRPVTCTPPPGGLFPPGKTTVTCSASDTTGHTSSATFTVWVQYQAPGDGSFFLKPIRPDGSSVFRIGRAVPVKFQLQGASAGIKNLDAHLEVTKLSGNVSGNTDCDSDEDGEDADMTFKYRKTKGIYGYRWKTRGETRGTYLLRADLGDGVAHETHVSLARSR